MRGRLNSGHIASMFKDISRRLHKPRKTKPKPTAYVRFVYKGQYYRRPIVPRTKKAQPPELIKLPPAGAQVVPQPFLTPPATVAQKAEALVAGAPASGGGSRQSTWSWKSWWKLNAPLVLLNFGSLATLMGFTRSDILELRSLAITGNVTFVIYTLLQPPPRRLAAVYWSALFATVNGVNIAKILNEREGSANLTPREARIYQEHFQPHGVTPKQAEKLFLAGEARVVRKGGVLARQGEPLASVTLVVRGRTRANVMGRHVTAMGSSRDNRRALQGGNSGAWVGEMAFVQSLWDRDQASKSVLQKKIFGEPAKVPQEGATDSAEGTVLKSNLPPSNEPCVYLATSTIVAVEDIEVMEWSFEDLEKVMKSSRYIQDSLTRAMTSAIVAKVVNFMDSRQSSIPKWSTMMDNWKLADTEEEEERELSSSLRTVVRFLSTRGGGVS